MSDRDKQIESFYAKPPVLRGRIYCSPWCGAGCTKPAFDRATKRAKALAKLLGPGWKPRVWENMGWHYDATKGCAVIRGYHSSYGERTTYMLLTTQVPQVIVHGTDPRKMVEEGRIEAVRIARGVMQTWEDLSCG